MNSRRRRERAASVSVSPYRRFLAAFGQTPMPSVQVTFVPGLVGNPFTDEAVIDSGSTDTWVPNGIPAQMGWSPVGLPPKPMKVIGAGIVNAPRYQATFRIAKYEHEGVVCEHIPGSGIQCTLVGQDMLKYLITILSGPSKLVYLSKRLRIR